MRLRPSNAHTWMVCKGQPAFVESLNLPPSDSYYAAEGRAAHALAAKCLEEDQNPMDAVGTTLIEAREDTGELVRIKVDEAFAEAVKIYVDNITAAAQKKTLAVEQQLDLTKIMRADKSQSGTGDAIIHGNGVLEIHDLKFGQGEQVKAKGNRQLLTYAAGAWLKYKDEGPFEKIKMVIHQPRIHLEPDSWTITVDALKDFIRMVRAAVIVCESSKPGENLKPGEKQCRWCPAKAQCPALEKVVAETIAQEPAQGDMIRLGKLRGMVALVETWTSAVCDMTRTALENGIEVPGWKLVQGRKGARKWSDEDAALERLKQFRLKKDVLFDMKLRSPTVLQKAITEQRYEMLIEEGLIVQSEGKPTVAPADSKKEGIAPAVAFDNLDA